MELLKVSEYGHPDYDLATREDLIAAVRELDGAELLKRATIRDERGNYRNGDFLVIEIPDD